MSEHERFRGIIVEDQRFESKYARRAVRLLTAIERFRSKEVEFLGEHFPEVGPAIIISNHPPGIFTVIDLPMVGVQEGRLGDVVVKETLLDAGLQESSAVLMATKKSGEDIFSSGSVDGSNEKNNIRKRVKKFAVGKIREWAVPYIRDTVNAIPIDREGKSLEKMKNTFERADSTLEEGRFLELFLQWSRTPQNSLENSRDFAATIVRRHKNVPVYIVVQVIDKNEVKHIIVDKPFVPELLEKEVGRPLTKSEYTEYIKDSMEVILNRYIPHVIR